MKMTTRKITIQAALCLTICSAWLITPTASMAQVTLGSWLSASIPPTPANDEGWFRGAGGFGPNGSIFASSNSPSAFDVYPNVVAGYSQSLVLHETGFGNVRLFASLTAAQIQAFTNNSQLHFTFSCAPGTGSGFMQMVQFQFNSGGAGFQSPGVNTGGGFSETGATNDNSGGQPKFFFFNGSPARSQVVTWDYSSFKPQLPGSGYVQLVFVFQTGGGGGTNSAVTNIFLNNITIGTPPTEVTYIVDDFATNGVQSTNPTNHDWAVTSQSYADSGIPPVWGNWFGGGFAGVSFAPNVDRDNNTNASGAMAIALTWNGGDQFVAFHGFSQPTFVPVEGGTASIGWPQYTNLSCDVKFDPSSAGVTNANGVLGVIRMGVRPVSGGQSWTPQANYVTITDTTNWYHINMPLNSGNPSVAAGNIADVLIGEDVGSYVPGGLNGSQILYVDNIKFTGPLTAPPIPPPTLGAPERAKPGLRIFAGSTVNTYDRQQLYTVDSSQSWIGGTYPVTYSYSLLSYNPTIQQVHLELTPSGTIGQYTDYANPNLVWMNLNPGPTAGQVVCRVQWKTNAPNSNPGINAVVFTNSTAVGTWSLVFTGPNNGYVVAPGHVILGTTNFTINDENVATDFANPMYAVFGLQPNTTTGQGQYIDYGMINITGVAGANEFEDFTTEGSDISLNLTPSGQFNNNASFLASSTIIVTTNDAYWINWTQPAANFTLATTTNLAHPNWINPGWYSQYSDTNAPRVMPLSQSFAAKFWVLLPKDDLPTANGQQNPNPPDAGPLAPNAFFLLSTNVVSP
jgi:hypothetical protein